jgi:hypothetical protein
MPSVVVRSAQRMANRRGFRLVARMECLLQKGGGSGNAARPCFALVRLEPMDDANGRRVTSRIAPFVTETRHERRDVWRGGAAQHLSASCFTVSGRSAVYNRNAHRESGEGQAAALQWASDRVEPTPGLVDRRPSG